jgi:hypothetical protein
VPLHGAALRREGGETIRSPRTISIGLSSRRALSPYGSASTGSRSKRSAWPRSAKRAGLAAATPSSNNAAGNSSRPTSCSGATGSRCRTRRTPRSRRSRARSSRSSGSKSTCFEACVGADFAYSARVAALPRCRVELSVASFFSSRGRGARQARVRRVIAPLPLAGEVAPKERVRADLRGPRRLPSSAFGTFSRIAGRRNSRCGGALILRAAHHLHKTRRPRHRRL